MARPLKPLVKSGGYYPSKRWTPLVYPGGYTTANGGGQPEPEAVLKTVTGSLVHITDALAKPVQALSVKLEPIQDLHGYDSPWPAGGGKNLFNYSLWSNYNVADKYWGVAVNEYVTLLNSLPAGTYTFSFKECVTQVNNTGSGTYGVILRQRINNKNVDVDLRLKNLSVTQNNTVLTNSGTFTLTDETVGTFTYLYLYSGFPTNGTQNYAKFYDIQLETGSSATDWSPYSNICPISGRTSVSVTRTGKNLLDKTEAVITGGNAIWGGTASTFSGLFILKAGTYTISCSHNVAGFYVEDSSSTTIHVAYNRTSTTFNNPKEQALRINIYIDGVTLADMESYGYQLELGSTATAYEPYAGNTYTIQLGDTVYGGTLDVIAGKMTVDRVGITPTIDLLQSINTYGIANFRFGLSDASTKAADQAKAICSALKYQKTLISDTTEPGFILSSASTGYLRIPQEIANTKETAQSWVSTNNVIVVYYLATPIEITLTPTQIEMLLGENNLWADAGDSTLTYYADGNASASEALGILLGGTYNNPGGADDVSDDEALGILLGGS